MDVLSLATATTGTLIMIFAVSDTRRARAARLLRALAGSAR